MLQFGAVKVDNCSHYCGATASLKPCLSGGFQALLGYLQNRPPTRIAADMCEAICSDSLRRTPGRLGKRVVKYKELPTELHISELRRERPFKAPGRQLPSFFPFRYRIIFVVIGLRFPSQLPCRAAIIGRPNSSSKSTPASQVRKRFMESCNAREAMYLD